MHVNEIFNLLDLHFRCHTIIVNKVRHALLIAILFIFTSRMADPYNYMYTCP